jgi:hypothetical protein
VGSASNKGSDWILGPFINSVVPPFWQLASLYNLDFSGLFPLWMLSSVSRSLGSVIFPVNAAAAAVSGLHKYILSSNVPERPENFRA